MTDQLLGDVGKVRDDTDFDAELDDDAVTNVETHLPNMFERLVLSFRHLFLKPIRTSIIVVYIIAFLDSFAYYAFTYSLIQHLGLELGLSDKMSYWFYGIFGISMSVWSLVFGFFIDRLGARASISISAAASFVGRLGLAYAVLFEAVWLTGILLFGVVAPSIALISPPVPIALKRYTNTRSRNIGMSLYYGIVNAGAFLVTPLVDIWRIGDHNKTLGLPPYAMVIAATSLLQIPILLLALFGMKNVKMTDDDMVVPFERSTESRNEMSSLKYQLRTMFRNRAFWKAFVLLACMVGAKSTFRYMDSLYLTYVLRAFPDGKTQHYLTLLAINPLMVIIFTLTGLSVMFTSRFNPIGVITMGAGIGGVGPLLMTFGPFVWALVAYVVVTTIGEIIWAPVILTYLANVATEGSEASWMALGSLPLFLSKLLTGGLTGTLTSTYCPDPLTLCPSHDPMGDFKPKTSMTGDPVAYFAHRLSSRTFNPSNDCKYINNTLVNTPTPAPAVLWGDPHQCYTLGLWGIIGATTITSFVALLILQKWLRSSTPGSSSSSTTYTEVLTLDGEEQQEDHADHHHHHHRDNKTQEKRALRINTFTENDGNELGKL